MLERDIKIINKLGLHARAAAKFVSTASGFKAIIHIDKDGQRVNGKSIMGVMMLAAAQGNTIRLQAEGDDATPALDAIEELIDGKFGESE